MSTSLASYLSQTGKTQTQFAAEVGVRPATVSAWMNGKTPRPPQMQRVAEVTRGLVPVTAWFDFEAGSAA